MSSQNPITSTGISLRNEFHRSLQKNKEHITKICIYLFHYSLPLIHVKILLIVKVGIQHIQCEC